MDHHPIKEALESGLAGILGGGAGFRYARIIVRDLPQPRDGERFYAFIYKVLQDVMDTGKNAADSSGGAVEGGGPK